MSCSTESFPGPLFTGATSNTTNCSIKSGYLRANAIAILPPILWPKYV